MGTFSTGLFTCLVFAICFIRVTHAVINITMRAKSNNAVKLPCQLPYGYTGVKNVRWYNKKDGQLTDGTNVLKHTIKLSIDKKAPDEWNLLIERVTMSFEDDYTCKTADDRLLSDVKLQVQTRPKIVEKVSASTRVSFAENATVNLTCTATGIPEPEITWYRGLSETATGVTGSVLLIPDASRYATDEYICRARNSNGYTERRIQVTINFTPEVTVMEPEVYAGGGEIVVMACAVAAPRSIEVFWTKGTNSSGKRIVTDEWKYIVNLDEESDNIPIKFLTLVIRKSIVSSKDYGSYTCFAIAENHVVHGTVELKERKQISETIIKTSATSTSGYDVTNLSYPPEI